MATKITWRNIAGLFLEDHCRHSEVAGSLCRVFPARCYCHLRDSHCRRSIMCRFLYEICAQNVNIPVKFVVCFMPPSPLLIAANVDNANSKCPGMEVLNRQNVKNFQFATAEDTLFAKKIWSFFTVVMRNDLHRMQVKHIPPHLKCAKFNNVK